VVPVGRPLIGEQRFSHAHSRSKASVEEGSPALKSDDYEKAVQSYNQNANVPVAFYGRVVDQDSNALQNVTVDLEVAEDYIGVTRSATNLQRHTGADGRFEVVGPKGHFLP